MPFTDSDIVSNQPAPVDSAITGAPDAASAINRQIPPANPPQAPAQATSRPQTPMVSNKIPAQPTATSTTVNPTAAVAPEKHPAVQRAGLLHEVAQALAGGPRMQTTVDADGTPRQKPVPLTGRQVAMAVALEAITGGLAGLAGKGPNAAGQGAALGLQQGQRIAEARKSAEQQEFENKSKEYAQRAAVADVNARTLLSTAQAEHYQLDALDKVIEINKPALDSLDESAILQRQVSQQELLDGMKSGKFNSTSMMGPVDGVREILNPDGSHQRWEATHAVIADPHAKVTLTPDQYDVYAQNNIPGFPKNISEANKSFEISYVYLARANEQINARNLATEELKGLRETLKGTPDEALVPKSIDFSKPGVANALDRFQRYRSHVATHGNDIYESLLQLGEAKRDPKTGEMRPNPDAKYADEIAAAYGGWNLIRRAHDKLEADSAATKAKAEAQARADVEIKKEKDLIPVKAATAGAEASARQKVLESSARNADGSWNPASIPVGLVQGTIDPTQLSKRSGTYNSQIQQANEYSLQTTGKPFDMAQAQSDFKYATALSTQNTLKFLNSLTGHDNKSGNLGALVAMSNVITRTDFPALNDAAAWARLQTGDKAIAQYHTTVTEVADQVAKILQGGGTGSGTSDAKLKQAQEMFDQGFNKEQVKGVAETLRTLLANRKGEMVGENRYLQRQYGKTSPAAQEPISATNPQTGERVISNDGGKTWQRTQ